MCTGIAQSIRQLVVPSMRGLAVFAKVPNVLPPAFPRAACSGNPSTPAIADVTSLFLRTTMPTASKKRESYSVKVNTWWVLS